MKVLKEGNVNPISMDVTCPGCGAVLRLEPSDLKQLLGDFYTCPCCSYNYYLKEVSDSMKSAFRSKSSSINFTIEPIEMAKRAGLKF